MSWSAPARIDLAGGTLDVPPLGCFIEEVLTLNLAVELRAAVTITPAERTIVRDEDGRSHDPADLPLFAKTLAHLGVSDTLSLALTSTIPRASGLGGSSSTLVALVHALQDFYGGNLDPEFVLRTVTLLEHRLLGKPAGTQDAIAAIYGGLNVISFAQGLPQRRDLPLPGFLQGPLLLAYSPIQHHSGINNWAIVRAACEGDCKTLAQLQHLNDNAHLLLLALQADDRSAFIECLYREARLRDGLCDGLLTPAMAAFARATQHRVAAKVCGAGGGGCMFLFGEDPDADALEIEAARHGLSLLQVMPSTAGCRSEGVERESLRPE